MDNYWSMIRWLVVRQGKRFLLWANIGQQLPTLAQPFRAIWEYGFKKIEISKKYLDFVNLLYFIIRVYLTLSAVYLFVLVAINFWPTFFELIFHHCCTRVHRRSCSIRVFSEPYFIRREVKGKSIRLYFRWKPHT